MRKREEKRGKSSLFPCLIYDRKTLKIQGKVFRREKIFPDGHNIYPWAMGSQVFQSEPQPRNYVYCFKYGLDFLVLLHYRFN